MGAGDSKLSFKKGVFRLAEEKVVVPLPPARSLGTQSNETTRILQRMIPTGLPSGSFPSLLKMCSPSFLPQISDERGTVI